MKISIIKYLLVSAISLSVLISCQNYLHSPNPTAATTYFSATGHYKSVYLTWNYGNEKNLSNFQGYNIYYSTTKDGTYIKANTSLISNNIFFHWTGVNDQTYYYIIKAKTSVYEYQIYDTLSTTTHTDTDEELLTLIQYATFRYFYDTASTTCGFACERYPNSDDTYAVGGTGMSIMALIVGVERGFISRESAANRVYQILSFAKNSCEQYHGAFSHWIYGSTGKTKPFDYQGTIGMNSADLVETSYFIQGVLTACQYFTKTNTAEIRIREYATQIWEGVDWTWFLNHNQYGGNPSHNRLAWNWADNSPDCNGWYNSLYISGFNECMIAYLLAIASPTHDITTDYYQQGYVLWSGDINRYKNPTVYNTHTQYLNRASDALQIQGMPLFWTQYSYLGFDPRNKHDGNTGGTYFNQVFKNISLIDYSYCDLNSPYAYPNSSGWQIWGLTACDEPTSLGQGGYHEHEPSYTSHDNGTIAPTAAISAMPYFIGDSNNYSLQTLRYFFQTYGQNLFSEYGFKDAFHFTAGSPDWYDTYRVSIDQGPIIIMIENYRTQLLWNLFMSHPDIKGLLTKLQAHGWTIN